MPFFKNKSSHTVATTPTNAISTTPAAPNITVPLARLRELERYEAAFLATEDGLHQRDLQTGEIYRSKPWKSILGYEAEDWDDQGDDWSQMVHPEDAESVMQQRAEIVSGARDGFAAEFRLRRREGDYVWVRARARLTRSSNGVAQHITGVFTDISAEKRLAEEREESLLALRRSQTNLRHVMQLANCLLWQATIREVPAPTGATGRFDAQRGTDLSWECEVFNDPEEGEWLPIDRHPGEALSDAYFRVRNREDALGGFHRFREALHRGEERFTFLYRTPVLDGSVRYLLEDARIECLTATGEKLAPFCAIGGGASPLRRWRLVAVATDITERKEIEEQLSAASKELRRTVESLHLSNEALSEFVSVASHDLKEPLRKIQTFGGMLRRRAAHALEPDAVGYLDRMTDAAARMQTLIEGLLQLARTSRQAIVSQPVDLNVIVRDVLCDLEVRIAEVGGRVEVERLPIVAADPLQMRQLFQNLIGNALKFHRPDQPPHVTVTVAPCTPRADNGPCTTIKVTDNGVGFSPDYAERIFKVFERLEKTERSVEGSGVGLAICRKIAERHGGTIHADSQPGAGATFTVTLPV